MAGCFVFRKKSNGNESAPRDTAHEADEMREYSEREVAAPAEAFGSLAAQLRGALKKP